MSGADDEARASVLSRKAVELVSSGKAEVGDCLLQPSAIADYHLVGRFQSATGGSITCTGERRS